MLLLRPRHGSAVNHGWICISKDSPGFDELSWKTPNSNGSINGEKTVAVAYLDEGLAGARPIYILPALELRPTLNKLEAIPHKSAHLFDFIEAKTHPVCRWQSLAPDLLLPLKLVMPRCMPA